MCHPYLGEVSLGTLFGTRNVVQDLSHRAIEHHPDHLPIPEYEHRRHTRNRGTVRDTPLLVGHPSALEQALFFSSESEACLANSGSVTRHERCQPPKDLPVKKLTAPPPLSYVHLLSPEEKVLGQNFMQNSMIGMSGSTAYSMLDHSAPHHSFIGGSSRQQVHLPLHTGSNLGMEHRNHNPLWPHMVEKRLGNDLHHGVHGARHESHKEMEPLIPSDITTPNAGLMETRAGEFSWNDTFSNPLQPKVNAPETVVCPGGHRVSTILNDTCVNPSVSHLERNTLLMTHPQHLQRNEQDAPCSSERFVSSYSSQHSLRRDRATHDQGHPGIDHPRAHCMFSAANALHDPQALRAKHANHGPPQSGWIQPPPPPPPPQLLPRPSPQPTPMLHTEPQPALPRPPPYPQMISAEQHHVHPLMETRNHLFKPGTSVDTGKACAVQKEPVTYLSTSRNPHEAIDPPRKRCRVISPQLTAQQGKIFWAQPIGKDVITLSIVPGV